MAYRIIIQDSTSVQAETAPLFKLDLPAAATAAQLNILKRLAQAIAIQPTVAGDLADFNDELANLGVNISNVANAKGNDGTRAATLALLDVIAAEKIDATNATAVKDYMDALAADTDCSDVVTAIDGL